MGFSIQSYLVRLKVKLAFDRIFTPPIHPSYWIFARITLNSRSPFSFLVPHLPFSVLGFKNIQLKAHVKSTKYFFYFLFIIFFIGIKGYTRRLRVTIVTKIMQFRRAVTVCSAWKNLKSSLPVTLPSSVFQLLPVL